jgi:hypothetical protein
MIANPTQTEPLRRRAKALHLNGLVAHWSEVGDAEWIAPLLKWEEEERAHRSLQRRIRQARLGHFKTMPTSIGHGQNGSTAAPSKS